MTNPSLTKDERAAAVAVVGELLDRLECVEDRAESLIARIRDRLTDEEIMDFSYAFCGILSEPIVRRIHEAYQREVSP